MLVTPYLLSTAVSSFIDQAIHHTPFLIYNHKPCNFPVLIIGSLTGRHLQVREHMSFPSSSSGNSVLLISVPKKFTNIPFATLTGSPPLSSSPATSCDTAPVERKTSQFVHHKIHIPLHRHKPFQNFRYYNHILPCSFLLVLRHKKSADKRPSFSLSSADKFLWVIILFLFDVFFLLQITKSFWCHFIYLCRDFMDKSVN